MYNVHLLLTFCCTCTLVVVDILYKFLRRTCSIFSSVSFSVLNYFNKFKGNSISLSDPTSTCTNQQWPIESFFLIKYELDIHYPSIFTFLILIIFNSGKMTCAFPMKKNTGIIRNKNFKPRKTTISSA